MSAAETLESVQTTDLVVINTTPAAIAFNYEETKAWLEQELKQYDVVVTADTLAGGKKLATELNKLASDISKRRRAAVETVSTPIKAFEDKAKFLEKMCKEGRQKLLDQIQVFEDETRAKAKTELERFRLEEWEHHCVAEEFRRTQVEDLIKISAVTKTGKLTAASCNEIRNRVHADKQLQQQTEMRLLHLENQSYKAGLAAPLARAHVEPFLFAPDDEYNQRLDAMLASELEREKIAEERTRKRLEAEQRRAEEEAQRKAEAEHRQVEAAQQAQQQETAHTEQPVQQTETQQQFEHSPAIQTEAVQQAGFSAFDPTDPGMGFHKEPAETPQMFAFGPLLQVDQVTKAKGTTAEIEAQAVELSMSLATPTHQPVGIWVPGKLVAIVYGGEVFRKAG